MLHAACYRAYGRQACFMLHEKEAIMTEQQAPVKLDSVRVFFKQVLPEPKKFEGAYQIS
jgi:hypothetical protein